MTEHFILEAIDTDTGCVAEKFPFSVDDLASLASALALQTEDFGENLVHELDQREAFTLREKFRIETINSSYRRFWLRHRDSNDDLPYEVHTNRELLLMLKGTKPLTHFSYWGVAIDDELTREMASYFEPHVMAGRIVKRLWSPQPDSSQNAIQHLFYALPGEEWRIDAFILLLQESEKIRWNEEFERREGELLGYTAWEMELHMKNWHGAPPQDQ